MSWRCKVRTIGHVRREPHLQPQRHQEQLQERQGPVQGATPPPQTPLSLFSPL